MGMFDEVFDRIIAMMVVIFRKTLRKSKFLIKITCIISKKPLWTMTGSFFSTIQLRT